MEDESASALEADPKPVAEAVAPETAESEAPEAESPPEEVSRAKERREREKKLKAFLREQVETAHKAAEEAETRRKRIVEAHKSEKAPEEKDFGDYSEFIAAKAVWQYNQKAADREAGEAEKAAQDARRQAEEATQKGREAALQSYAAQAEDVRQRITDFDQVVKAPGLFPAGSAMVDLILHSEQSAELAYAVAKDRALHDRLLQMPPIEAARELGRLEASLSAPKPRTETKAPEPITPVRGAARATPDPESLSMEDYIRLRKAGKIR